MHGQTRTGFQCRRISQRKIADPTCIRNYLVRPQKRALACCIVQSKHLQLRNELSQATCSKHHWCSLGGRGQPSGNMSHIGCSFKSPELVVSAVSDRRTRSRFFLPAPGSEWIVGNFGNYEAAFSLPASSARYRQSRPGSPVSILQLRCEADELNGRPHKAHL
jgi:hypothetical protein